MAERIAIFPGSFDPPHLGHLDALETASKLFDKVIWAIGTNVAKKSLFSLEQRLKMMQLANRFPNVEVAQFNGLLVRFAERSGGATIVRSLRSSKDFNFEFEMTLVNSKLAPELATIYLPAKQEHLHISSTLIRELVLHNEPVDDFVPEEIKGLIQIRRI